MNSLNFESAQTNIGSLSNDKSHSYDPKKNKNTPIVMKRYELKYIITKEQAKYLENAIADYMKMDDYGKTSVMSIYYDTTDYQLIRHSLEKPNFKEKIRLRSYGLSELGNPVYLELKRKANDVVYKRRMQTTIKEATDFFNYKIDIKDKSQIAKEITYFRNNYGFLVPTCLIIYDRVAYYQEGSSLRLTIDYNPRYRCSNLCLNDSLEGIPLIGDDKAILEIKIQDAIPLWLSHILDKGNMYKNSFSKYGTVYEKQMSEEKGRGMGYYV